MKNGFDDFMQSCINLANDMAKTEYGLSLDKLYLHYLPKNLLPFLPNNIHHIYRKNVLARTISELSNFCYKEYPDTNDNIIVDLQLCIAARILREMQHKSFMILATSLTR